MHIYTHIIYMISLSLSTYIYIYIYTHVHTHTRIVYISGEWGRRGALRPALSGGLHREAGHHTIDDNIGNNITINSHETNKFSPRGGAAVARGSAQNSAFGLLRALSFHVGLCNGSLWWAH